MNAFKKAGLGLQNPTTSADKIFLNSQCASMEIIWDMMGESQLFTADNLLAFREEMSDIQKRRDEANAANIRGLVKNLKAHEPRLILCAKNTGSWLTVWGTMPTGTVLAATESCVYFWEHYNVTHPNLKKIQHLLSVDTEDWS